MLILIVSLAALGIAALWALYAERHRKAAEQERDVYRDAGRTVAELADQQLDAQRSLIEVLEKENAELRDQLRRRGVMLGSAFESAKRFHRARFERGVEILRRLQDEEVS